MKKFFEDNKKTFIVLSLVYFISFIAILKADYYYIDDLGRASAGYKGWANFSRYISVWLSTLLHGGNYLADSAPLPQIIAILLMGFAGTVLISLFNEEQKFSP